MSSAPGLTLMGRDRPAPRRPEPLWKLGAQAGSAAVVELAVEDDDPLFEQPAGEVGVLRL